MSSFTNQMDVGPNGGQKELTAEQIAKRTEKNRLSRIRLKEKKRQEKGDVEDNTSNDNNNSSNRSNNNNNNQSSNNNRNANNQNNASSNSSNNNSGKKGETTSTNLMKNVLGIQPAAIPVERADLMSIDPDLLSYITKEEFGNLPVSVLTRDAIAKMMKYKYMTQVQAQSIPEILKGVDAFVKARTGTGKTLAFLIPSIEVHIIEKQNHKVSRSGPPPMMMVLSPTRELAQQIAHEAELLCTYHKFQTVVLVGGTNMGPDVRALNGVVDILVATPGRMLAHLTETNGVIEKCSGVKVLILDEADRLLDMGFKRDLDKILSYLPQGRAATPGGPVKPRQTLLFSATFSNEVKQIAANFLRKGYTIVDAVGEEAEQTHSHVPQNMMIVPQNLQIQVLARILEEQMKSPNYKIMVFLPTARQTGYLAGLFNEIGVEVLEIHSRKSQSVRTKTSEEFRNAKRGIMFSSDVTARGMDYPDVTLVLQMGMTTKEQYTHRLGRTARAGKEGSGLLFCAPFEEKALLKELDGMPITRIQPPLAKSDLNIIDHGRLQQAQSSYENISNAKMAWGAWLGFYNGCIKKLNWRTSDLVDTSLDFALSVGLKGIPPLPAKTLGKMGLRNVPGLIVETSAETNSREADKGGGRGGGRGGGGGGGGSGRGRPVSSGQPMNTFSGGGDSQGRGGGGQGRGGSQSQGRGSGDGGGRGGQSQGRGSSGGQSQGRGSGGPGGRSGGNDRKRKEI